MFNSQHHRVEKKRNGRREIVEKEKVRWVKGGIWTGGNRERGKWRREEGVEGKGGEEREQGGQRERHPKDYTI